MSKLNAEELASKRWPLEGDGIVDAYAAAIREVAQPIADERDELREALDRLLRSTSEMMDCINPINYPARKWDDANNDIEHRGIGSRTMPEEATVMDSVRAIHSARTILAKYPNP